MATLSVNNINKPAPRWFRKTKRSVYILSVAANAMIAKWPMIDPNLMTLIQLWCTMGIMAIFEALEICLKDDGDDAGA